MAQNMYTIHSVTSINGMMRKRLWQVLRDGLHFFWKTVLGRALKLCMRRKWQWFIFKVTDHVESKKGRILLTVVLVLNVKQLTKRNCCRMTLRKFSWFIIWLYKELLMTLRNFAWFIIWLPIYHMLCVGIWTEYNFCIGSVRLCCLMSSDVGWHIRDKLRPVPKHGSINLYVHGNQKAR